MEGEKIQEIVDMQRERVLSDAELLRRNASYVYSEKENSLRLDLTNEQVCELLEDRISYTKELLDDAFINKDINKIHTLSGNILSLEAQKDLFSTNDSQAENGDTEELQKDQGDATIEASEQQGEMPKEIVMRDYYENKLSEADISNRYETFSNLSFTSLRLLEEDVEGMEDAREQIEYITSILPGFNIDKLSKEEVLIIHDRIKKCEDDPTKILLEEKDYVEALRSDQQGKDAWADISEIIKNIDNGSYEKGEKKITENRLLRINTYIRNTLARDFEKYCSDFNVPAKSTLEIVVNDSLIKFEGERSQQETENTIKNIRYILMIGKRLKEILSEEELKKIDFGKYSEGEIATLKSMLLTSTRKTLPLTPKQRKYAHNIIKKRIHSIVTTPSDCWEKIQHILSSTE
ncbi:MAG: hypothetical protein UV60_C0004G0041 [Parcubacteria group bacterium GW2011_GWA2_43_11]|nr:MAG: hypothetical protein UU89_C0017G0028 [Parcubacteria group bacterium GW2011_GWC2_42_11]KKS85964.1 MAG: hypothetical protein UV60_C0004G0041 [Parcubacteria group bacterium GW2011_GWA2_43_11]